MVLLTQTQLISLQSLQPYSTSTWIQLLVGVGAVIQPQSPFVLSGMTNKCSFGGLFTGTYMLDINVFKVVENLNNKL